MSVVGGTGLVLKCWCFKTEIHTIILNIIQTLQQGSCSYANKGLLVFDLKCKIKVFLK